MPVVKTRLKKILLIIVLLLAVPLAWNALSYINFNPNYNFLQLKKKAIETGWYLPAYYAHVLMASIILLIGFFQVYPGTRIKWNRLHRFFGKIYVGGILFFSAPGGFVMSLFINRGPWVLASFLFQCCLWFAFTYLAYKTIRKGNVIEHRKWMLRSFALTLAAITLRLYVLFRHGLWT